MYQFYEYRNNPRNKDKKLRHYLILIQQLLQR